MVDGSAAFAQPLSCGGQSSDVSGEALGFIWLFNPGYTAQTVSVTLDDTLAPFNACLVLRYAQ